MNALSILTVAGTIMALALISVVALIGFVKWSWARDINSTRPSETLSDWE